MSDNAVTKPEVKKVSNLVGCDIVLNGLKAAMYKDPKNKFTIGFLGKMKDRITITSEMDLTIINKSIKSGVLKVYKENKDISVQFGGSNSFEDLRKKNIVKMNDSIKNAPKKVGDFLYYNNSKDVIARVNTIVKLSELYAIRDLESMGRNNVHSARADVLDSIRRRIREFEKRQTPLSVSAGKMEGKDEIITAK